MSTPETPELDEAIKALRRPDERTAKYEIRAELTDIKQLILDRERKAVELALAVAEEHERVAIEEAKFEMLEGLKATCDWSDNGMPWLETINRLIKEVSGE